MKISIVAVVLTAAAFAIAYGGANYLLSGEVELKRIIVASLVFTFVFFAVQKLAYRRITQSGRQKKKR